MTDRWAWKPDSEYEIGTGIEIITTPSRPAYEKIFLCVSDSTWSAAAVDLTADQADMIADQLHKAAQRARETET